MRQPWRALISASPWVLVDKGVWRMWYVSSVGWDLTPLGPRHHIKYAESRDGIAWERRPEPVFREGAGAVHVSRIGVGLVMLIESQAGVRWADAT